LSDTGPNAISAAAAVAAQPDSLRGYIARTLERTLADCTRCGKCYDACPMPAYSTALGGAASAAVVGDVLSLLRGGAPTPQALEWTRLCTQSATCIPACPEGINPMLMLRFARMTALGAFGGEARIPGKDDPEFFLKILAFAKLNLTDEELARLR
jgi:ferredoxin